MEHKESDAAYYQHRAEQETELARRAEDPAVVAAHYKLAQLYLERIAEQGPERETSGDRSG